MLKNRAENPQKIHAPSARDFSNNYFNLLQNVTKKLQKKSAPSARDFVYRYSFFESACGRQCVSFDLPLPSVNIPKISLQRSLWQAMRLEMFTS